MNYNSLLYEVIGPILTLTIHRPKALNALNGEVLDELGAALGRVATDDSIRVIILTGSGEKAFVAGADIAQMAEMAQAEALRFAARGHQIGDAIAHLPQPVIAAVNGFALGGGTELALACDLIYASTKARFGQPEVTIGVMPGFGGTQRLPRLIGPARASEMIFTGDQIDAQEALRIGLVNAVLDPDELLPHCTKIAERIASRAPRAVALSKRAVRLAQELPLAQGNSHEQRLFAELFDTADQKEGMHAFLAKRPPHYTGK